MARFRNALVAALGALGLIAAGSATGLASDRHDLLEFHSMFGVHGAAVGAVNHRGTHGGGLPWKIASAHGEVGPNGAVRVQVKGLVIPVAPFKDTNPVPMFGDCELHHRKSHGRQCQHRPVRSDHRRGLDDQ